MLSFVFNKRFKLIIPNTPLIIPNQQLRIEEGAGPTISSPNANGDACTGVCMFSSAFAVGGIIGGMFFSGNIIANMAIGGAVGVGVGVMVAAAWIYRKEIYSSLVSLSRPPENPVPGTVLRIAGARQTVTNTGSPVDGMLVVEAESPPNPLIPPPLGPLREEEVSVFTAAYLPPEAK